MPAFTVQNPLDLPRLARLGPNAVARPVGRVVTAHHQREGAGFEIWRPFPGELSMEQADPFLLLDQGGPVAYGPDEALGAPWHPHRGFETVTYDGTSTRDPSAAAAVGSTIPSVVGGIPTRESVARTVRAASLAP
jgi:hypothetical protein